MKGTRHQQLVFCVTCSRDSELQSSDLEDDSNDSENDAQSNCYEIDGFVEHNYEVLFVP